MKYMKCATIQSTLYKNEEPVCVCVCVNIYIYINGERERRKKEGIKHDTGEYV